MPAWLRARRPGTSGILALLMVAIAYAGAPEGTLVYGPAGLPTLESRARVGVHRVLTLAVFTGIFMVWGAAVRRWGRGDRDRASGWFGTPRWRCEWPWLLVALGAIGTISLLWVAVDSYVARLWSHGPPGKYNELPNLYAPTVVAALVLTVVCAPVFEELAIRGGAQSWLARRLPWPVALVLATSLFTAMHGVGPGAYNSVQLVNVFLFGLTFGLLYQATGSVAPGMVAHAGVNGAILLSTAAPVSLVLVLLDMVAVGLIGVAVLARRRRDARAGDPDSGGIAGPPVQTWESQAAAGPNPPLEARMESWSPSPTSRRCWPPLVPYPPN